MLSFSLSPSPRISCLLTAALLLCIIYESEKRREKVKISVQNTTYLVTIYIMAVWFLLTHHVGMHESVWWENVPFSPLSLSHTTFFLAVFHSTLFVCCLLFYCEMLQNIVLILYLFASMCVCVYF